MPISVSDHSHFLGYTSFPFILFLPLSQDMYLTGRTPKEEGLPLYMADLVLIGWAVEEVSFYELLTE